MNWFDKLDPLNRFAPGEYVSFWERLFQTILSGVWPKTFAVAALLLSVWFGVYRRQPATAISFFVVALSLTYGGWILVMAGF